MHADYLIYRRLAKLAGPISAKATMRAPFFEHAGDHFAITDIGAEPFAGWLQ